MAKPFSSPGIQGGSAIMNKPARGWLHPDEVFSKEGVPYTVRYVGNLEVLTSVGVLDFDTRSAIAKECINRVVEAANLKTINRRRRTDKKIASMVAETPNLERSGENVELTINSSRLKISELESKKTIFLHEMPSVSFASGGDAETIDFVAYVGKDRNGVRGCFVIECDGTLAQKVITTIGQAFELRFKEFMKQNPNSPQALAERQGASATSVSPSSASGNTLAPPPVPGVPQASQSPPGAHSSKRTRSPRTSPRSKGRSPSPPILHLVYPTGQGRSPDGSGRSPTSPGRPGASSSYRRVPPPDSSAEYYNDLPGKSAPAPPTQPPAQAATEWHRRESGNNLIDFNTELPHSSATRFAAAPSRLPSSGIIPSTSTSVSASGPEYVSGGVGNPGKGGAGNRDPFDMSPFEKHAPFNPLSSPPAQQRSQLEREDWYHGSVERADAERLLQRDGDFLVRESQGSPGQYVLTGMQNNSKKHLLLVDPQGIVRTRDRAFESVSHLIAYHRDNNLPIISKESTLRLVSAVKRAT